ncbi:MAG: hypothetical protein IKG14_06265 [Clostridia bacterium]|nr:hypothetical protein [Clostridia bacterium]
MVVSNNNIFACWDYALMAVIMLLSLVFWFRPDERLRKVIVAIQLCINALVLPLTAIAAEYETMNECSYGILITFATCTTLYTICSIFGNPFEDFDV